MTRRIVDAGPAATGGSLVQSRPAPDDQRSPLYDALIDPVDDPTVWTPEALDRLRAAIDQVPRSRTVRAAQLGWWRVTDWACRFRAWVVGRP